MSHTRRIRELVLDVTNKCLMRCLHCSAGSAPYYDDFISLEKATQTISEAARMGLEILSFSGGEPLIHPDIVQMIEVACSFGIRDVRIFTSGLKLRNSEIAPITDADAESLADAGLTRAFFNLQGASFRTLERITGTPNSHRAVSSGSRRCKEHGIYVGLHFVPMKLNWKEIMDVWSMARHLDADEIGILRFVPQGRGMLNRDLLEMDAEDEQDFLVLVSQLIGEYDRPKLRLGCPFNSISELIPTWKKKRCPAASEMCHVLIDGTVAPCSAFKHDSRMKSGNVYLQGFRDIWQTGFPIYEAERAKLCAQYECTAQIARVRKTKVTPFGTIAREI